VHAQPLASDAFHPQVEDVCSLLRQPHVRLLSLVGPSGAGKSRLAEAVTAVVRREFAHGAVLVDLARVGDQSGVSRAVAEALRADRTASVVLVSELVGWLRGKQLLLVLDNCDDLRDGGPVIARLLAECPRLRVLVTSRGGLRVRGEHRFSVRRGRRRSRQSSQATPLVLRQVAGLTLQPAVVPSNQQFRLFPLTRREQAVATLLALGFTNTQIADELVISYRTAETHACRVLRKLGFTSRNMVVNWALERGLVMVVSRRAGVRPAA
jgi:predicted ATPase